MSDIFYDGNAESLTKNKWRDPQSGRWLDRGSREYYDARRRADADAAIERRVDAYHRERLAELKQAFYAERRTSEIDDQAFAAWLNAPYGGGISAEETVTVFDHTGFTDSQLAQHEEVVRRHLSRSEALARECRAYRRELEEGADDENPKVSGSPDGIEYKSVAFAAASIGTGLITGYASTFSDDLSGERVVKGAYAGCLRRRRKDGRPFPILFGHDPARPIGSIDPNDLKEDDTGLLFKGRIDASTPDGQWALSGIKEGYLAFASVGFRVLDEAYDKNVRLLQEIELYEVSCVSLPAQPEARIKVIG